MNLDDRASADRDAQLAGDLNQTFTEQIESRMRDVHTCLPGVIVSFDPDKQTAQVQPGIQRIFIASGPVNLPLCLDVPVAFPGGGDFFLTFPVQAGDECILIFSERAIDYWYLNGGQQLPYEYRLHDLSDAIAMVGLNSQPNALSALCTTGAELRTRDGETFVRVEDGTVTITASQININGPVSIDGDVDVTGTFTSTDDTTGESISLHNHKHGGVTTGSGQTGMPV